MRGASRRRARGLLHLACAGLAVLVLGAAAAPALSPELEADDALADDPVLELDRAGVGRADIPGRVAPFVVSPESDVERMLDLADLAPSDYLIDLGSGEGRIVIAAARRGALAHGVEIDPELVAVARARARRAGVEARAAFVTGDLFEADFRHATVVTLYLFPEANLRLRPQLLEQLAPGTRVLSNSFDMGDWRPDARVEADTSGGILLWIVPADLAGRWDLRIGARRFSLRLFQHFQDLSGELREGELGISLRDPRLEGDRVRFEATVDGVAHAFHGRLDGAALIGTVQVRDGDAVRVDAWRAVRAAEAR